MAVAHGTSGLGTGDRGLEYRGAGPRDSGFESRVPAPASRVAPTVERLDDPAAFVALRGEWRDLLRDSALNNPFLTSEWLQAWWAHLRTGSRLELIVVRSGGLLVGLAPMHLVGGGLPWFSRLEFLGTGAAGSDYLDLILRQGYETESLRAIGHYLVSRRLALRLTHLRPASWVATLAAQLAGAGWAMSSADDGTCPIIPLAGHTFDSYLGTLGSSHRANVRRRLKALNQDFEVRFDLVTTHAERCEMLGALVGFHERRYKERGGSSAFDTPAVIAFQDEASRHAFDSGFLRMYALRLNGQLAAVMYGFLLGGRFYFYQHGFDDRYKAHSIGLVLMALTVRAALDEGAAEFDMLWGVEAYKFLWARDARVLQRVDLFPIHIGGVLHRHALEARRGVKQLARRVLAIGVSLGS